jgi:hypothetical protein
MAGMAIRCGPPISIVAPPSSAIRWRRCAMAWPLSDGTACARIRGGADVAVYAEKSGVPEAALAMGDIGGAHAASRDKAPIENAVRARRLVRGRGQCRRRLRRNSSSPMPISPARA